ncbi:carbonic anhydrase [Streptomyces piniterrae]|uniref:Carbonic anhydrase n=1 Tax=Streptomyces piniterrae TaxID=2571125 RepID=A0A4U0P892_9ACTN|nr:carbonic anhydrase [Streptomyces piniterrae]TJZ58944.1 carbonic anhydrase [Streptomyces piniterrae]
MSDPDPDPDLAAGRALAEGVRRFQRDVFPAQAELFERLAATHRPTALFIGCSDARVVPELITQRRPGELFVIRTAGNLVPAYTPGADGVAASIEYAVGVLGVTDVIVCGHSGCGAMTSLALRHDLTGLPAVADWLRHADEGGVTDDVAALVRHNIRTQLTNLVTHPSVARALDRRSLTLHGWVYDIRTGAVEELDPTTGRFTALAA